jgi:hypothetical protein
VSIGELKDAGRVERLEARDQRVGQFVVRRIGGSHRCESVCPCMVALDTLRSIGSDMVEHGEARMNRPPRGIC